MSDDLPDRPLERDETATEQAAAKAKADRDGKIGCFAIAGLFVLVVGGCSLLNSGSDTDPADDEYVARAGCQEFVERRLKSPATADFDNWSAFGGAVSWTVSGTVDAENSFGAKLRMSFTCAMHQQGDRWVLDSLTGLT